MNGDDAISSEVVASLAALNGFKDRVERHGLWNGAWIGVVAIRQGDRWISFLFRGHLTAPGVRIPPPEKVFDATTSDVIVRTRNVNLDDFWRILEELARGETTSLSTLVGQQQQLHIYKNANVWSLSPFYRWKDRANLHISHWNSAPFHDIFGYQLFEHLGPQLRARERPYSSLREIADAMMFFRGGGFDGNNANPISEASAEFPIQMINCFYNRAHRGIEIQLEVGANVPLDRLSASLAPEPRQRLAGNEFSSEADGEILKLRAVVPCEESQTEVAVNLQFDDVDIASSGIRVAGPVSTPWGNIGTRPGPAEWEATLSLEFHWTRNALRRRLRAMLPSRVAEVAEWRIRESILLREEHPFFAVASAASVAEVLLKERLAKVTRKARTARWTELRSEDPRLPKKLPGDEHLKFEQAIRLARRLGLLGGIDSNSIDLLRAARNQIHLDRKSRPPVEDFSPARASHAILATLDLCKLLGSVTRARPIRPRPKS